MSKLYEDVNKLNNEYGSVIATICKARKNQMFIITTAVINEVKSANWQNKFSIEKDRIYKVGSAWLNYCMVQNTNKSKAFKFNIDFYFLVKAKPNATDVDCVEISKRIKTIINGKFNEMKPCEILTGTSKRAVRLNCSVKNADGKNVIDYSIDIGVHILRGNKEVTYINDNDDVATTPFEYNEELTFNYWEQKIPLNFKDPYRWALKTLKYIYYYNNTGNEELESEMNKDKFLSLAYQITTKVIKNSPHLVNDTKAMRTKRRAIGDEINRKFGAFKNAK